ncbi:TRAP transporter large permease [Arcobacter sp.]|uniref:TRAP transporter large permease n=1 Tax=Arcobacter sp. TaxID=1872629 RepID=UPI003C78BDF8
MIKILMWAFPIFLLLAVPVAYSMLGAAGIALWIEGKPLAVIAQRLYTPTQSFPMLAIPFFILTGSLMMSGTFGTHLVKFAKFLVGRFKGGMAQVSILGSIMFGGVSGSAVADASALGNALIPIQKKEGYPGSFAAAVNACSSTVSVLIPPSIPLILYGLVSNTSIINLFVAGILPGLIIGISLSTLIWYAAKKNGYPTSKYEGGWTAFKSELIHTIPAIFLPIFIIATLRFGIATPTEVSVLAVAYALFIGFVVYRDLTIKKVYEAIIETGIMTGAVLIIIMASSSLQWILTLEQAPQNLALWLTSTFSEPWMIILTLNLIMLIVGTFLDLPAAILLLGPLFVTIANAIGLDLVQLGIIMVLNLAIGLYTPPVGTTLFISAIIAREKIGSVVYSLIPFYLVILLIVLLFSFIPSLTIY